MIHITRNNISELEGSGSPLGVLVPAFKGQFYRDISLSPNRLWISVGITNSDWVPVGISIDEVIHTSEIIGSGADFNWVVKRTVVNKVDATFEIYVQTRGNNDITINDIIPINFLGRKWFKINRYLSMILRIEKDRILRQGTFSADMASPIITGAGTAFLTDIKQLDAIYDSSGNYYGTVSSVDSDTQFTLSNNSLLDATNEPVFVIPYKSSRAFTESAFNNLINTYDGNPITALPIYGWDRGVMCQYEGTLGTSSEMPPTDSDPLTGVEYVGNYPAKHVEIEALNMTYRATKAGVHGSGEGEFKLVLQGYLL